MVWTLAEIEVAVVIAGVGVTGTDESAVVPSPSWPVELLPQHFMAARPTLAQLWLPPAATADALEMPDTGTGEA